MTQTIDSQELAIVTQERNGLVQLVADPRQIVDNWRQFQDLKKALLDDTDYHTDQGRTYIKKSGWRKIAAAFGINVQEISKEQIATPDGRFAIQYTVRASAPGGRYADGIGLCDNTEKRFLKGYKINDIYATAYTRAANRAVSDLVGGGDVSAEEISAGDSHAEPEHLSQKLQDRLFELADQSQEHYARLATLVLDAIGVRYLTKEQATAIGKTLAAFKPSEQPLAQVVIATATELTPEPDEDENDDPPLFPEDEPAPAKPARLSQPAQDFITKIQQAPHLDALKTLTLEMSRAGFRKGHPEYGALSFAYQQAEAKIREVKRAEASGN